MKIPDARALRRYAPPRNRFVRYAGGLILFVVLLSLGFAPALRVVGSFLVIEDSLQRAAAIVVMGGQTPFRELEAAKLFGRGWAPKVILVRGAIWPEQETLSQLDINVPEEWQISREVLLKKGVPLSAIVIPNGRAEGTLEE